MNIIVKSVLIMAARRKTRRGRRRNRPNSSRRKLFVPVVHPNLIGRNWKESLRSSSCRPTQEKMRTTFTSLSQPFKDSTLLFDSFPNKENSEGCEFSFSHWWHRTPQKKSQTLVRPPYTPTAPNNSTQYIINDRVPFEDVNEMQDDCKSENLCNLNGSLLHGLGRTDFCERLTDTESICKTPESEMTEIGSVERLSPTPVTDNIISKPENEDSYYESPEDIDFFSFVQNDFLESYENMKRDSLLRLSKDELISKVIGLEKKFDSLAKIVYPEITALL